MRKSVATILAAATLLLCGCASLRLSPEEKARIASTVQENLDNRAYRIDVTQMNPRRGPSRQVNGFSLEVQDDRLISHLPYFGEAWSLPYGGGKGMNFESEISDYIETFPKADRRQILLATNNGEDSLVFTITVFTNGRAIIEARSRNRDSISYYGTMQTD